LGHTTPLRLRFWVSIDLEAPAGKEAKFRFSSIDIPTPWLYFYHVVLSIPQLEKGGRMGRIFGDFIKERRLACDLSLREFARRIGDDPSNWSKVERGILSPPTETKKLGERAKHLGIKKGSDEWDRLEDLASVDSANIPAYIMENPEALAALPAFFRTIGSVKPSREEIEALLDRLKER
jgi:transcriptional regulator with XRE-family HTH domain